MKRLTRRTDLPCGAPVTIFVHRNSEPPTLPGRVVTVNPVAMMVAPRPVTLDPIPARAVVIVPRPMSVIPAIANLDRESNRLCRRRSKSSRAKERAQKDSKFVFHSGFP